MFDIDISSAQNINTALQRDHDFRGDHLAGFLDGLVPRSLLSSRVFNLDMFAWRTRHAFCSDLRLAKITLLKYQYHTTTVRMQKQKSPKVSFFKSLVSKISTTLSRISSGIPRQTTDISIHERRDGDGHSIGREEIEINLKVPASTTTDRFHQKPPKSSLRAKINRLRNFLGPSQTTIHNSETILSTIIIEDDPEYDIISSRTCDVHGNAISDPGLPPILSLRRLPYVLDKGSLSTRPQQVSRIIEQVETDMVDVFSTPSQMDNLLNFCLGKSQSCCFVFYIQSGTLVVLHSSPDPWDSAATSGPVEPRHDIWGRIFEDAFTMHEPGIPPGSHHVQTIRYAFGSFAIALQCEIDSFDDSSSRVPKRLKVPGKPAIYPSTGRSIRSSDILELKCLHRRNWKAMVNHYLGQSWFARRKRLLVGIHDGDGVVDELKMVELSKMLQSWKLRKDTGLARLHDLLCRLKVEAANSESGICWALRNNATSNAGLEIFALNSNHDKLYEKYKHLDRTKSDLKTET